MIIKRTLIIIITFISALIMILVYSFFNGVPFGNYIAKAKITDYVKQVYSITEEFKMPQYNFKNSDYSAAIPQNDSEFMIFYNLLSNTIYDEKVSNAYNSRFQKEYEELKKSYGGNIELPIDANIGNKILANGNYSHNIYKLTCSQMIYLLSIVNHQKISFEDSTKMPAIITKGVLDKLSSLYNITSLQVIYTDLNGSFEIVIKGKNRPTVEKMQKHTSKMDNIGEVERNLIYELNK